MGGDSLKVTWGATAIPNNPPPTIETGRPHICGGSGRAGGREKRLGEGGGGPGCAVVWCCDEERGRKEKERYVLKSEGRWEGRERKLRVEDGGRTPLDPSPATPLNPFERMDHSSERKKYSVC